MFWQRTGRARPHAARRARSWAGRRPTTCATPRSSRSIGPTTTSVNVPVANPVDVAAARVPPERDRRRQPRRRDGRGPLRRRTRWRSRASCRRSSACATTASTSTSRTTARRRTSRATTASSRRASGLVYKPVGAGVALRELQPLATCRGPASSSSSLSLTNQALDPEKFRNYELGAKWDVAPGAGVHARRPIGWTAATWSCPIPSTPRVSILVDGQRTTRRRAGPRRQRDHGLERRRRLRVPGRRDHPLALRHRAGRREPRAAPEALVLALEPLRHLAALGRGLGRRSTGARSSPRPTTRVVLPGFTRVDAAVFFTLGAKLRAQLNVENLLRRGLLRVRAQQQQHHARARRAPCASGSRRASRALPASARSTA